MSKSFTIKKWNSVTGLTLLHASCLCRRWKGEEITKDWKGERHRVLCTLSQDTLNAVSDQNLLWTQTATETVPQSWSPTWLGHVCALSCSSLSLLHNRIWPRGQKFIPPSRSPTYIFYKVRLYNTYSLLLSLLFLFYMENTIITRKVFTAFLPHLKNILPDLKHREHGKGPATTWNTYQLPYNTTAGDSFTLTCNSRKDWSIFLRPKYLEGQEKDKRACLNQIWKE